MDTEPRPRDPQVDELEAMWQAAPARRLSEERDFVPFASLPEHGPVRIYAKHFLDTLSDIQLTILETDPPEAERARLRSDFLIADREMTILRQFDAHFQEATHGGTLSNSQASALARMAMMIELKREDAPDCLERMDAVARIHTLYLCEQESTTNVGREASSSD